MGLSLRSRRRPTFTDAERAELLDQLLAERWTPPEPTPTEAHLEFVEACQERDRLGNIIRAEAAEIAAIEGRRDARLKARPAAEHRLIGHDTDAVLAPHRARQADAEAALADLNAVVDWDVLLAGEKRFRLAVADLARVHDATRAEVVARRLERAEQAHAAARRDLAAAPNTPEVRRLAHVVADREVDLILARQAADAVDTKGRRR